MKAKVTIYLEAGMIVQRMELYCHGPGVAEEYWREYFKRLHPEATSVDMEFEGDTA